MSRRTYEAAKAIREAWEREQKLVQEGKGTRDWTPEQQQDILDKGKAYAEDGRAFEGHHMKSAEAYPDFQGNPDNIQFLSRSEHLEAHGGYFQNPSNGYFDPVTKTTYGFGDNPFEPCNVIDLSDPIVFRTIDTEIDDMPDGRNTPQTSETMENNQDEPRPPEETSSTHTESKRETSQVDLKKLAEKLKNGATNVVSWSSNKISNGTKWAWDNKGTIAKGVGLLFIFAGTVAKAISSARSSSQSSNTDNTESDSTDSYSSSSKESTDSKNDADDEESYSAKESTERSSPVEHTVKAHKQRYNGVWKEKQDYTRGGHKNEE